MQQYLLNPGDVLLPLLNLMVSMTCVEYNYNGPEVANANPGWGSIVYVCRNLKNAVI